MKLIDAINDTILYSKNYQDRLSKEEIFLRLISKKAYSKNVVYKKMAEMGIRTTEDKIEDKNIQNKTKMAKDIVKSHLSRFSSILMVGITGSVAAGTPKKKDDIDLLIVSQVSSLWITRLWLKFHLWKDSIPQRWYGKNECKDELCFNLWLEENSLAIPKERRNLKNAMDLIMMKPIFNKRGVYERFLAENDWVKDYLATGYTYKLKEINRTNKNKRLRTKGLVFSFLNFLAFAVQYIYMKRKMTAETVDYRHAFFHPTRRG